MEKETLLADKLGCNDKEILAEMWQEAYQNEERCSFRVISGSMKPVIEVGDVVRIIRVPSSSIHTGDVAAFKVGKKIVVHRVIGKSKSNRQTRFRHMGDACRKSGKFLPQHLIGMVKAIEKEGREIRLDSPGNTIGKKFRVWRLLFIETVNLLKNRHTRMVLLRKIKPLWSFSRNLLLRG